MDANVVTRWDQLLEEFAKDERFAGASLQLQGEKLVVQRDGKVVELVVSDRLLEVGNGELVEGMKSLAYRRLTYRK